MSLSEYLDTTFNHTMLPEQSETSGSGLNNYTYYLLNTIYLPVVWLVFTTITSFLKVFTTLDMNTVFQRTHYESSRSTSNKRRSQQYVLVTGCDRGFGNAIAKKLDEEGFRVIAGCLEEESLKRLTDESSPRMMPIKLDVTNPEHLNNTYTWLSENLRGDELRGIVNNAGICFVGTPEIMSSGDISKVIDVNFRGTVNVTKTFMPFIRQSQGRIVNIGSINGDVPMPFFSIYNATKAAIKMFTESLAFEVRQWGVKVSLVAPAGFKTGIIMYDRTSQANKWWAEAGEMVREDYGKEFFHMPMRVSGRIKVCDDYSPVVSSVMSALTDENPKPLYRVGAGSVLLPTICQYAPRALHSYICGSLLNFIAILPDKLKGRL